MPRRQFPWIPLLVASPALLAASAASAHPDLTVEAGQVVYLDGARSFRNVLVKGGGAKIRVRPKGTGAPVTSSGRLELHAHTIIVEAGGLIDATGAGYAGVEGGVGLGGLGGTAGSGMAAPGGGGAHVGDGGNGCFLMAPNASTAGLGGQGTMTQQSPPFGSAGGAALYGTGIVAPNQGGNGGGEIVLIASAIQIDGTVRADGDDGLSFAGIGSGGGAGGFVELRAFSVTGSGVVSVVGGRGGGSFMEGYALTAHGGAGGGGRVAMIMDSPLTVALGPTQDDAAAACNGTAGDHVPPTEMPSCDVDGDMVESSAGSCGGTDCDDSDASINPSALEACDGEDNNCDGAIDGEEELAENACPEGNVCAAGACEPAPGEGGGTPATPQGIEYHGACQTGPGAAGAGLSAILVAGAAFAASRRRSRSRAVRR